MEIVSNELMGMYAAGNHPDTSGNPVPWKIKWVKIKYSSRLQTYIVYIRGVHEETGAESFWFPVDQCFVFSDPREVVEMHSRRDHIHSRLAVVEDV